MVEKTPHASFAYPIRSASQTLPTSSLLFPLARLLYVVMQCFHCFLCIAMIAVTNNENNEVQPANWVNGKGGEVGWTRSVQDTRTRRLVSPA